MVRREAKEQWVAACAAVVLVLAAASTSAVVRPRPQTAARESVPSEGRVDASPRPPRVLGAVAQRWRFPPQAHRAVVAGSAPAVIGGVQGVVEAPAPPAREDEVVIVPPPVVFDAPAAPPPPPPAALQAQPATAATGRGTWAVIIGINDYPGGGSDLRSAVNDANDVDAALAGVGVPANQRLVLRNGQATTANLRAAASWLVSNAGPDAVAVWFYNGHVRKLDDTTEAMVGADGQLVSDRQLAELLAPLASRQAWIAMAACYGGGFTEVLAPGRVLTGAAPADARAYESSLYNRSYMVQFMVREAFIERRAPQSVQAAYAYARTEIAREHPGRQPVQIEAASGPLDLRHDPSARPVPSSGSPGSPGSPSKPPPAPTTTAPPRCLLLICGNG